MQIAARGSFLSQVFVDSAVLMAVPLAVAIIGVGAFITNTLPAGPAVLAVHPATSSSQRWWLRPCSRAPCMSVFDNEFCLSWRSIDMRDKTLSPVHRYAWRDFIELHTVCAVHGLRRHSHQAVGARFLLADGSGFWRSGAEYGQMFGALLRMLQGGNYKFDDSDFDETCSPVNHALFSRLP